MCDSAYPSHLLPGWEETSIAFHTDEGSIFHSTDDAIPLNTPCSVRDVVKLSISKYVRDPSKVLVEFFCNGTSIYSVSSKLPFGGFYGVIGLMSKGERIAISPPVVTSRVYFEQVWEVCTPEAVAHEGYGVCAYSGLGDFKENSIGTVRSKAPINLFGSQAERCFEIRIVHPGEARYIAIGVVAKSYPLNMLPGWDDNSIGYHADNGNLFHNRGEEEPTNHPCKEGDVMKCTIDPIQGSEKRVKVIFHRNQVEVGHVMSWTPSGGFHLCVGMMSRKEKVQILLPEILTPFMPRARKRQPEDVWEELDKNLVYRGSGVYQYRGSGGQEGVGSIRSKGEIDPKSDNWFEVKILNPGQHCYIALGVCSKFYAPTELLGWNDLSVGFHADNGLILQTNVEEQSTNHPCSVGDVIRCTVDAVDGSDKQANICFHRNGSLVGQAIFWKPGDGYFAQIGCMSVGEVIQVSSPLMDVPTLRPGLQGVARLLAPMNLPMARTEDSRAKQQPAPLGQPSDQSVYPSSIHYHQQGTQGNPPYDSQYYPSQQMVRQHPRPFPPSGYHHPYHRHVSPHHPRPFPHSGYRHLYHHGVSPHHPRFLDPMQYLQPGPAIEENQDSPESLPANVGSSVTVRPSPHQLFPQFSDPAYPQRPPWSREIETVKEFSDSHSPAAQISSSSPTSVSKAGAIASPEPHKVTKESSEDNFSSSHSSSHHTSSPLNESIRSLTDKSILKGHLKHSTPVKGESKLPDNNDLLGWSHGNDQLQSPLGWTGVANSSVTAVKSPGNDHPDGAPVYQIQEDQTPVYPNREFISDAHALVAETMQVSTIGTNFQYPNQPVTTVTTTVHTPASEHPPRPPLLPQLSVSSSVVIIPKEENRTFKILHNVVSDSEDPVSFESSLPEDEMVENAFIVHRMPLSEKLPYFEVEIQHIGVDGNVAVGVIWNNYPVFHLPGALQGSIAFHSLTGSAYVGGSEIVTEDTPTPCSVGDIIGCRALLRYKSEVGENEEKSIQVEFYLNGCLLTTTPVFLPPSGFIPAVGLKGHRTKVKVLQNLQLTPETFFKTHPIPKNHRNFPSPSPLATGWHCLNNSKITDKVKLSKIDNLSGFPCIIQNCCPLSRTAVYFETELQYPIKSFSVVSIGAMPKAKDTGPKKYIPGEVTDSVGFLPLLGFIMKNGSMSCSVPEVLNTQLYSKYTTLGVGVDFHSLSTDQEESFTTMDTSLVTSTTPTHKVRLFFTINGQQVCSIMTHLPVCGLFPTLAVDSDSADVTSCLAMVQFPQQWPLCRNLPMGFSRGSEHGLKLLQANRVRDVTDQSTSTVRAIQAAVPLSPTHSYFQVQIIYGGETFKISCGLASYNYSLSKQPGWDKDSIALHADDGNLFHNSSHQTVAPPSQFRGTVMGCGARFHDNGTSQCAEVFFTLNKKIVAKRFMKVPQLGLFPTVGMRTNGAILFIDLEAPDPFPDMEFNTTPNNLCNLEVVDSVFQLALRSEPGAGLLSSPTRVRNFDYFDVRPLSKRGGRIMVGYTTSYSCPLDLLQSGEDMKAFVMDITLGIVMEYSGAFQSKESCSVENCVRFGCGFIRQPFSNKSLIFFTADNQVVSYVLTDHVREMLYPCLLMIDSNTRLTVNMCALWPNMTSVGLGWARFANVKLENSTLIHSTNSLIRKSPVGFLQSCSPVSPLFPYFEIRLISRAVDKAIAVGLASRRYSINSWIGWSNESVAYHLDDGKLFKVSSSGESFGPKAFAGDTVGCGVRFGTNSFSLAERGGEKMEVFFTINGAIIGTRKVHFPAGGMFPTLCLESSTESAMFYQHSHFPPTSSMVSRQQWNSAYCVVQSGSILTYSCRHREPAGGYAKGFCQARLPFSPQRNYFEVELTGVEPNSHIQVGPSAVIVPGSISPNTYGLLYNSGGNVITRKSVAGGKGAIQKYTNSAQSANLGDRIGCYVNFEEDIPTSVEFSLNGMKINKLDISKLCRQQSFYPTIVLNHPGESVLPLLNLPKPQWDGSTLVGWLRSERVKLKSRVIEYVGLGGSNTDTGVAQVSLPLQIGKDSYFEIEILDPGARGTISIGVAPADYDLSKHPGWGKESIGFHGDDGSLFQESGTGIPFGDVWQKRDVIGLGILSQNEVKPGSEVRVYFTKNGVVLGHASHRVPPSGLFPTIGLHSPGEKVKVHFQHMMAMACNMNHRWNSWRSLNGIHVSGRSGEDTHILTFRQNGRRINKKFNLQISLAVAAQPFSDSMQYFEVDLLDIGTTGLAVGVSPCGHPLDHVTGWSEGSVGYHTDDGCLYTASKKGNVFGPVPHKGE